MRTNTLHTNDWDMAQDLGNFCDPKSVNIAMMTNMSGHTDGMTPKDVCAESGKSRIFALMTAHKSTAQVGNLLASNSVNTVMARETQNTAQTGNFLDTKNVNTTTMNAVAKLSGRTNWYGNTGFVQKLRSKYSAADLCDFIDVEEVIPNLWPKKSATFEEAHDIFYIRVLGMLRDNVDYFLKKVRRHLPKYYKPFTSIVFKFIDSNTERVEVVASIRDEKNGKFANLRFTFDITYETNS